MIRPLKTLQHDHQRGFTIVELLIVVVVIAILAAIVVVAYTGVQQRAQQSKISSDLKMFEKAIHIARYQTGQPLGNITGNFWTAGPCLNEPSGTDLSALPQTDSCWTNYESALDKISSASGVNIRGLVDPWNRPYYLDENEYEGGSTNCTKDNIAAYSEPFISGTTISSTVVAIANSMPNC